MSDEMTPPSDVGAERQLLGAALHNPRVIDDITDVVDPGDFYRPAHETIWRAILAQHVAGEPVDATLVKDQLAKAGQLEHVGGAGYLFEIVQGTLTATNAAHYAGIVARHAGHRRIIQAGIRITQIGYGSDGRDLTDTQEVARSEVDKATGTAIGGEAITWVGDEIDDTLSMLETEPELRSSPWVDLDHIIGGFAPGRLYVIGARPGVGKTVFGVQTAAHHATRHETHVVLASLEMSRQEIHMRLLSQLAKVDYTHLERHQLDETDWSKIAGVRGKLATMPLSILDRSSVRISDIRRYARSVSRRGKLGMIVVDYLQLMSSPPGRQPRHEVVADFSRGLKLLARELGVPVLAMSQLNRASEQRTDKMPGLADLRESGAVEQDSDVVILLHRDLNDDAKRFDLHVGIAKNRHGTVGGITLEFQGHLQRAVAKAWTPTRALEGAA
jgi:replicative DNA helicase